MTKNGRLSTAVRLTARTIGTGGLDGNKKSICRLSGLEKLATWFGIHERFHGLPFLIVGKIIHRDGESPDGVAYPRAMHHLPLELRRFGVDVPVGKLSYQIAPLGGNDTGAFFGRNIEEFGFRGHGVLSRMGPASWVPAESPKDAGILGGTVPKNQLGKCSYTRNQSIVRFSTGPDAMFRQAAPYLDTSTYHDITTNPY